MEEPSIARCIPVSPSYDLNSLANSSNSIFGHENAFGSSSSSLLGTQTNIRDTTFYVEESSMSELAELSFIASNTPTSAQKCVSEHDLIVNDSDDNRRSKICEPCSDHSLEKSSPVKGDK